MEYLMNCFTFSAIAVLFTNLFSEVSSLECIKCAHVTLDSGSNRLASLIQFLERTNNPECATLDSLEGLDKVTCPSEGNYVCGYANAKTTAYAHLVGRIELSVKVRDCIAVPDNTAAGCYEGDSYVHHLISSILPDSIVSTQPQGKVCFCDQDQCKTSIPESSIVTKWCPKSSVMVSGTCIHWWVFLLAIGDLVLLLFIIIMISCCLCQCCPCYPKRRVVRERHFTKIPREFRYPQEKYWKPSEST